MKKILLALAILVSATVASTAQVKPVADAKKAAELAKAASENPKKATKVATWLKLAEAYLEALESSRGAGWVGGSEPEIKIVLGNEKPSSEEEVVLGGATYLKQSFATRDYYFDENGMLAIIDVTNPVYPDILDRILNAYAKAGEVDTKGSKLEDINAGIDKVNTLYMEEAMNNYMFGKMAEASKSFEKAAAAAATAPLNAVDSTAYYNAGYTALAAGLTDDALRNFQKCYDLGYYYDGGEVFSKIAEIYAQKGDAEKQAAFLEEGFMKFPSSQSILIGLINYYLSTGTNTDKLFDLLKVAEANEPNNASLFYVEGNIHKQFGQKDEAIASYDQAAVVNPNYEWGYIGKGILYYEDAVEITNKAAEEMDDEKYMALVELFEKDLMDAMEPFEKGFEVTQDPDLKAHVAEYLKNIYYRFMDKDPKYKEGYEKYNAIVKGE